MIRIDGHSNDDYNGIYIAGDLWNGFMHFVNENNMHLYYYKDNWDYGRWCLDNTGTFSDGTKYW